MTKMETINEKEQPHESKRQQVDVQKIICCADCLESIFDRYFMEIDGKILHEKCVRCTSCNQNLFSSCFTRNAKLYCKDCYERLQSCKNCLRTIAKEDLVMRVGNDLYHVTCFSCGNCRRILQTGDNFHSIQDVKYNKICCKKCYGHINEDSDRSPPCNESNYSNTIPRPCFSPSVHKRKYSEYSSHMSCLISTKSCSTSSMTSASDSMTLKRPRTILTTSQRKKFKASFEISQKPCKKARESLANETGLTPRVVQVWFQNQRAKMKKIGRQQKEGCSGSSENNKQETDSGTEDEVVSSPGSYSSSSTHHPSQYYNDHPTFSHQTSWDQTTTSMESTTTNSRQEMYDSYSN